MTTSRNGADLYRRGDLTLPCSSPTAVDMQRRAGEHVAGKQDATVREEDRGMANRVRLPGSTRINPSSPRTTMELVQTHALCRTQTPWVT